MLQLATPMPFLLSPSATLRRGLSKDESTEVIECMFLGKAQKIIYREHEHPPPLKKGDRGGEQREGAYLKNPSNPAPLEADMATLNRTHTLK